MWFGMQLGWQIRDEYIDAALCNHESSDKDLMLKKIMMAYGMNEHINGL